MMGWDVLILEGVDVYQKTAGYHGANIVWASFSILVLKLLYCKLKVLGWRKEISCLEMIDISTPHGTLGRFLCFELLHSNDRLMK